MNSKINCKLIKHLIVKVHVYVVFRVHTLHVITSLNFILYYCNVMAKLRSNPSFIIKYKICASTTLTQTTSHLVLTQDEKLHTTTLYMPIRAITNLWSLCPQAWWLWVCTYLSCTNCWTTNPSLILHSSEDSLGC